MTGLRVRAMQDEDAYFVATCSHVRESDEMDECAADREALFRDMRSHGCTFKVAHLAGRPIGFGYGVPIEQSSWGPLGDRLWVIPCLFVLPDASSRGAGRAILDALEADARAAGCHGVTITGYRDLDGAAWFMPASFFERAGYGPADARGSEVLLWKRFVPDAAPPHFLEPHFVFQPVEGRIVVDLFWNAFCPTSSIEARRVRDVCGEFGDRVVLREYQAENRSVLLRYQMARAIYVNGREIGWGYEAPREGIRLAIEEALAHGAP